MSGAWDEAGAVRPGEALDVAALARYLKGRLEGAEGPLVVEQFPHGHSNLTYLVRCGAREWVLRRPPFGNTVKSAHDMGREHRVLSRLSAVYPPAPAPLLYCDDERALGAPFYLMERRRGTILRRAFPPEARPSPERARRLGETLIDQLADLHSVDYRAAGLGDLGKPEGYVERQVAGWTRRYEAARTDDHAALERAAAWLLQEQNRPAPATAITEAAASALVHNDFKFDNLVLDPNDWTRVVAVLDWEMATIGDPLMDLGTTLAYWVGPDDPEALRRFLAGPATSPGAPSRREAAERYGARAGRDVSGALFYYVFGLFKVAGIAQQIYARYVRGATRDPRFSAMGAVVEALGEQAARAIEVGRY